MNKHFACVVSIFIGGIASISPQSIVFSKTFPVQNLRVQKSSGALSSILWVDWKKATVGAPGSALGTIATASPIKVKYRGEVNSFSITDNSFQGWNPESTFSGGAVGNPPPVPGDMIALSGGSTQINKIIFSTPVQNPVLAIWSLGRPGITAKFVFPNQPFSIQSGGPNIYFGGNTITSSGKTVFGQEGNGTIQFLGTYSTITWRNPISEIYSGFTVGVPEP